jgi:hypothetical protein
MDVCVRLFCVCAVCVQVTALRRAEPPFKKSNRLFKDQETGKVVKAQQRAIQRWMDGWIDRILKK